MIQAGSSSESIDGVVDVALGPRRVDMFVVRKANKSYPATVTLGLDVAYTDLQGTLLQNKNCKSVATGEVEARGDMRRQGTRCCGQASHRHSRGRRGRTPWDLYKNTGTRPVQKTQRGTTAQGAPVAQVPPSLCPLRPVQCAGGNCAEGVPRHQPRRPVRRTLSFRTILRDQNQNHVLSRMNASAWNSEVKTKGRQWPMPLRWRSADIQPLWTSVKTPVSVGVLKPGKSGG